MTGAAQLDVQAETVDDRVWVSVSGEVDLSNANDLERRLGEVVPNRAVAVTVDLGAVDYIDSVGIRVLFGLVSRLDTAQIGLSFAAPRGSPARRVIELSGLAGAVALEPPA